MRASVSNPSLLTGPWWRNSRVRAVRESHERHERPVIVNGWIRAIRHSEPRLNFWSSRLLREYLHSTESDPEIQRLKQEHGYCLPQMLGAGVSSEREWIVLPDCGKELGQLCCTSDLLFCVFQVWIYLHCILQQDAGIIDHCTKFRDWQDGYISTQNI